MPQKIYLIRHGETDSNKNHIVQGWQDSPLNSTGKKQAKLLAQYMSVIPLDAIFTSDLKRTIQTAAPLAKIKKITPQQSPLIKESNMGIFEGKTWETIIKDHPKIVKEYQKISKNHDWKGHGGESINDVAKRVREFISHLFNNYKGQSIAVFTHGGTKRNFLHNFRYRQLASKIPIPNTSITLLEKQNDGKYSLKLKAQIPHLQEEDDKK